MNFNKLPVAERDAARKAYEEKFAISLYSGTVAAKQKVASQGPKKKEVSTLLRKIHRNNIPVIRSPETYKVQSYNEDKQLYNLIRHMYVKYNVPSFMYECLYTNTFPFAYLVDIYHDWFATIAQGGSFQKKVKEVMTKREAVLFLKGPYKQIHLNIWYAKMAALNMNRSLISRIIDKLFINRHYFDDNGRYMELIHFFNNHFHELEKDELDSIFDFVNAKLSDKTFFYKGRTASSMITLANEWHIAIQKAKLGSFLDWAGMQMDEWDVETYTHIANVVEITNNNDLYKEGKKQRHCVYSYVERCRAGYCSIFSLRVFKRVKVGGAENPNDIFVKGNEEGRITIEVNRNSGKVVQARGFGNRLPNPDEVKFITQWAGTKGIIYNPNSNRWY